MWDALKAAVAAVVYENGTKDIGGDSLQGELFRMIDALGAGYLYLGVLPDGYPTGVLEYKAFGMVSQPGTYAGQVVSTPGVYVVRHEGMGAWFVDTLYVKTYNDAELALVIRKSLSPFVFSSYLGWQYLQGVTAGDNVLNPPLSLKNPNGFAVSTVGGAQRVTYTGTEVIGASVVLVASVKASTNDANYSMRVHKNGVLIPGVASVDQLAKTTDADNTVAIGDTSLAPGDYLEMVVNSAINTTYTFPTMYFSIKEV